MPRSIQKTEKKCGNKVFHVTDVFLQHLAQHLMVSEIEWDACPKALLESCALTPVNVAII